jgi:DNA-binding IclR family transcriptional regulator
LKRIAIPQNTAAVAKMTISLTAAMRAAIMPTPSAIRLAQTLYRVGFLSQTKGIELDS